MVSKKTIWLGGVPSELGLLPHMFACQGFSESLAHE